VNNCNPSTAAEGTQRITKRYPSSGGPRMPRGPKGADADAALKNQTAVAQRRVVADA
jgi:hypothetical protein